MKRLFEVTSRDTKTAYFDNKILAKKYRDECIEAGHRACVSKGPYHAGFGIVHPNSIHPKRTKTKPKKD